MMCGFLLRVKQVLIAFLIVFEDLNKNPYW